ncbi:MAG: hypothetical protein HC896_11460 [Bacteroidales bacterium]|nr:hypothetical protein [Bacteroidales bacterium]
MADAASGKPTKPIDLPGTQSVSCPAWSPDGSKLALSVQEGSASRLAIYDFQNNQLNYLTGTAHSFIQASWSPDGRYLVCASDTVQNEKTVVCTKDHFNLVVFPMNTVEKPRLLKTISNALNVNPIFTPEGNEILFLSDWDGFRDLYKISIETKEIKRLTRYATSISGLTPLSPAISMANNGTVVYSMFQNHKYAIYSAHIDSFKQTNVQWHDEKIDAAVLSPVKAQKKTQVDSLLNSLASMRVSSTETKDVPFKTKFKLDNISNTSFGVASGRLGTGVAGSVSMIFSDIAGQHQLYGNLALSGDIYDFGGQVAYVNQKERSNGGHRCRTCHTGMVPLCL